MLTTLRRDAYVGENRCWPCTVANLLVLTVVVIAIGLASPFLAVALGIAGLATIALRGYVVPYTPQFAPRLVDRLPWNPFHASRPDDRDPGTIADVDDGDDDGDEVLANLVAADVIVPEGDELFLSDAFRERWREEIEALRESSDEALAEAALAASPAVDADVVHQNKTYVVLSDGTESVATESWLSRPVAIAEIAAARTLEEWDDAEYRPAAAHSLVMFLNQCPVCDSAVEAVSEADLACCGPPPTSPMREPRDVLVCRDCGVRLYTLE